MSFLSKMSISRSDEENWKFFSFELVDWVSTKKLQKMEEISCLWSPEGVHNDFIDFEHFMEFFQDWKSEIKSFENLESIFEFNWNIKVCGFCGVSEMLKFDWKSIFLEEFSLFKEEKFQ